MVSVRLEHKLIECLGTLTEGTHRSRGTYLRMALWVALPALERIHWEQVATDFEELDMVVSASVSGLIASGVF